MTRPKHLHFVLILLTAVAHGADSFPERLEAFVKPRLQTVASDAGKLDEAGIQSRTDPGALFLAYAFGVKRNAAKLLTADQAQLLNAVIDKHSPVTLRWHDERNTLRCKFGQRMWQHAAATDAEAPKLRAELDTWMRLRMKWTEQEHLAQYRFGRDFWNVLGTGQRKQLLGGEWKAFAKQGTGHTYDDTTQKVITRAIGKPDNAQAFEMVIAAWAKERVPLHEALTAANKRERLIVFAMDLNSESMAHAACIEANSAFAKLFLAEAGAFRRIVQAAYVNPQARCAKAAAAAWAEAPKRFLTGASELISLLASPP